MPNLLVDVVKSTTWIYFTVISDHEILAEEAYRIQAERGRDPRGYGWPDPVSVKQPDGLWRTTWHCYASCD